MSDIWKPSVTVAAIVERDGRFLLVEEETGEGLKLNQPAGHLDPDETIEQAVIREAMEETAWEFVPSSLIGVYMSRHYSSSVSADITYVRFAFAGELGHFHDTPLDEGIVRTLWMTRDEIAHCRDRHRNPLVLQCIDDYLQGKRAPLSLLYTHPTALGMTGNQTIATAS